jgi:hypothetical protein
MEAPTQLFKRTEQTKHGLIRDDDDDEKDPMLHTLEIRLKKKTL